MQKTHPKVSLFYVLIVEAKDEQRLAYRFGVLVFRCSFIKSTFCTEDCRGPS